MLRQMTLTKTRHIGWIIIIAMLLGGVFCCAAEDDSWAIQTEETPAFAGEGTIDQPWVIANADDMELLRQAVAAGESFDGEYLKLENDISLPADWKGVGALKEGSSDAGEGRNILPFCGTLDGNGCTVTSADGGRPLFEYVRGAVVRNLKIAGKNINGSGLIRNYGVDKGESGVDPQKTATVENVIIRSGTSIQGSGIVSGYASAGNTVDIRNCVAEEDVIVGCGKNQSWVGSFAGNYNGTITGCTSAATVYGVNFIGGIIGARGNSMSQTSVSDCAFSGQVIASGTYAGGIAGGGYGGIGWGIHTAPNAPMLPVTNCLCTGTVQAGDVAGGIIGYETSLQVWENGKGHLQSNLFAGTVTATEGSCVGGIAGAYRGLDRYNIIRDNYYADSCGAQRWIGGAEYVDTSCTTHETEIGTNYFDTSKEIPVFEGVNTTYQGNLKADHNRTDDPLGVDADSLAKAVTAQQLADGTVTAWLNEAEGSLHNWIQKESLPVLQGITIPVGLALKEGSRTDYYIGESLDPEKLSFTLTWSDGHMETVEGDDEQLSVTGFDSSKRASLTVTAVYKSVRTSFRVRILQPETGEKMTVTFSVLGDRRHGPDADCGVHTRARGNLTEWIAADEYLVSQNCTAEDLIRRVLDEKQLGMLGSNLNQYGSLYISGVQIPASQLEDPGSVVYLKEKDNGPNAGWMYAVNDEEPGIGVGEYFLEDGDEVILFYTDDYTKEKSADPYQSDPDRPDPDKPDPGQTDPQSGPSESDGKVTQGMTCTEGGNQYLVTEAATGAAGGEVTFRKAKNRRSVTVPKTVKLADGKTYRITKIGRKAFAGKKIRSVVVGGNVTKLESGAFAGSGARTVTLKTKLLKKASVRGSLKRSKVKTIRVKVGKTKENRTYAKKYRKCFTKKNAGRKCSIR